MTPLLPALARRRRVVRPGPPPASAPSTGASTHAALVDPATLEALARRAVEVAQAAGASYADARLTRTLQHHYNFSGAPGALASHVEVIGFGVRVLVNSAWGFSASPVWTADEAVRLAQEAVAQATINARGPHRPVDLGTMPAVTGRWATPVKIDPFSISVEEKSDLMAYWQDLAQAQRLSINPLPSYLHFARQEQTLATSAGTLVSQTRYESGGHIELMGAIRPIQEIAVAAKGWELFLDADIPGQIGRAWAEREPFLKFGGKPARIGKYTLVCDGVTMAHLVAQTFGLATQLDRALGYEANAGGTSFLDDPLGMLGTLQVAAPLVTITANRSAPAQLATVKWDTEGVEPEEATLVKQGVLHDFQTTREQAAWLAPYYQKTGQPVRSHGYAAAEDGLAITMQQQPNLALVPGSAGVGVQDLISTVKDGILVTGVDDRYSLRIDQQARTGYFTGAMQQIRDGRLGPHLGGGAILFNSQDLWKHVVALGGPATVDVYGASGLFNQENLFAKWQRVPDCKGQPPQLASYSAQAPAAVIADQPLISLMRKA